MLLRFGEFLSGLFEPATWIAILMCSLATPARGQTDIRLVDGYSSNEGTLLVLHNSTWGLVCDDGWNLAAAHVACRQAGLGPALEYTTGNRFGSKVSGKPIHLDDVRCEGTEAALTACRSRTVGSHDCQVSEAAGVRCSPLGKRSDRLAAPAWNPLRLSARRQVLEALSQPNFSLSLVPFGLGDSAALLASVSGGPPGPVCVDSVTLREANVICRQLGRGFGRFLHKFPITELILDRVLSSGNASRPVLTLGNCRGNETAVSQCAVYGSYSGSRLPCKASRFGLGVACTSDLPDLVPDAQALQDSVYIANVPMYYLACALEEKCASPVAFELQRNDPHWTFSSRVLLRFSSIVANEGTRDFLPLQDTDTWKWHLCHMHYHSMAFFASYEVYRRHSRWHQTLASGHKASFCLEDNACREGSRARFRCSRDPLERGSQGISPGCKDVYLHDLDCQWLDVTELPYGRYGFRIVVNPEYLVAESSYENNAVICSLYYTLNYASLTDCRLAHPFEF